jgi:cell division protein FtsW
MAITVGLIIAEPDLGATVVIVLMMVGIFFLAGAPPTQFAIMLGAVLMGIGFLIVFEPYRMARALSFTNPWADPLRVISCPMP